MSCSERRASPWTAPTQQRGVVLIVILVIVALVALIATQITSQLFLNERRAANIFQTDQAWQYVRGAEALAATNLYEALKRDDKRVHLGQAWAKAPFVFPIEGGELRGKIEDLSTCFNLNALLVADKKGENPPGGEQGGDKGQTPNQPLNPQDPNAQAPAGVQILQRLFEQLVPNEKTSPQALTAALVDWLDEDSEPYGSDGAEDYDYQGLQLPYRTGNGPLGAISELRTVRGFSPEIYQKVRPYLCALPDTKYTTVNVNTLPPERAELLVALTDGLSIEAARQVLQTRPKTGFKDKDAFWTANGMPAGAKEHPKAKGRISTDSGYFLLRAQAVVGRGQARVESVLKKQQDNSFAPVSRAFAEE